MKRALINILSWNIKGYIETIDSAKINKILDQNVLKIITDYDIVFLQETHLQREDAHKIQIPGFSHIHYVRPKKNKVNTASGGLSIFINSQIRKYVKCLPRSDSNIVWLQIHSADGTTSDTYIGCAYIPPENSSFGKDNTHLIWDKFEHDIELYTVKGNVIVCGDLNARTGNMNDFITMDSDNNYCLLPQTYYFDRLHGRSSMDKTVSKYGRKFVNMCTDNMLSIMNGRTLGDLQGRFTCNTPQGSSVVDYFACSQDILQNVASMTVKDFTVYSDHCPIELKVYLSISKQNSEIKKPKTQSVHNHNKKGTNNSLSFVWDNNSAEQFVSALGSEAIQTDIRQIEEDLNHITKLDNSDKKENVDRIVENLTDIFKKTAKISLRMKRGKKSYNRKPQKKWFNQECYVLRREIKSLLNAINRYPNKPYLKEKYFVKRKIYNRLLKRRKKLFKDNLVHTLNEAIDKDPSSVWHVLKELKGTEEVQNNTRQTIGMNKWMTHLEQLLSSEPQTSDERKRFVENELKGVSKDEVANLDFPVDNKEITLASKHLKSKKSPGKDGITNEMIKASMTTMTSLLRKTFDYIIKSGEYPEIWKVGINIPIYKTGDPSEPGNYRGITLNSSLGNLFCQILNNRINNYLETNDLLAKEQAGFRKHFRTTDQIFILKNLVDQVIKNRNSRLYCCFVDFRKAFDNVWHTALLLKLHTIGIRGHCFNIIKTMYQEASVCTRKDNNLSAEIPVKKGVHQGNTLSPTLFNIFINDLPQIMDGNDSPNISNRVNVPCLLYADDIVLLSLTKTGLQNKLTKLHSYCEKWAFKINTDKTKVIIFAKCDPKLPVLFQIGNDIIQTVDQYKYLGVIFHKSGTFKSAQEHLAKQANKALHVLKRAFNKTVVHPDTIMKIFDSTIKPILTYGAEIWVPFSTQIHTDKNNTDFFEKCLTGTFLHENIHVKFCKYVLGVHKKAMNIPVMGELGRYPITIDIVGQIISFWIHVLESNENSYLRQVYNQMMQQTCSDSPWLNFVKNTLYNCDLWHVWENQGTLNVSRLKYALIQILEKKYESFWDEKKKGSSKLKFYDSITKKYKFEPYLVHIINISHRKSLTKLRIGAHDLMIEIGRYNNTPKEERKCKQCGTLEDETHFLDKCMKHHIRRMEFIKNVNAVTENNSVMFPSKMLQFDNAEALVLLGKFVCESFSM